MAERRDPEQERTHRRRQLVLTLRAFALAGFDEGAGGHVTARDPIEPDTFWINPFGRHFGHVRDDDLLRVDHTGEVVAGTGRINPAGYAIHSAIHKARPDVVAAAHTHSIHGRAFSALGRPLAPITQDACAFFEDHGLFDDYTGVVIDVEEGKRIAHALGDHKAAILRNHGILTVGHSVDEAAWLYITMERSCEVQLLAEAAGQPISIEPEMARLTHEQVGTERVGWFQFQPLLRRITREQPDLLD
ncbi:MAG: class II aldolase/adducin family protein [Actinoplanes sp.]